MKFTYSNNFLKTIAVVLGILFCGLLSAPPAKACDPLGCLFSGHEQDALILGEVIAQGNSIMTIKTLFVFPQTQIKSLKEGSAIQVNIAADAIDNPAVVAAVQVGNRYLLSLNKHDDFYVPKWGMFAVNGTDYATTRLVEIKSIDDEAMQIFINSGGTDRNFGFDYSGFRPVLIHNGQRLTSWAGTKIYFLIGAGFGLLIVAVIIFFATRKHFKKRTPERTKS